MPEDAMVGMVVRFPKPLWRVLRRLAEEDALQNGGRPSAAGLLRDLVSREAERREKADA